MCTTSRARLAAAMSHTEIGMGSAQLSIGALIGVNAGAFSIDCRPQDVNDGFVEVFDFLR